MTYLIHDTDEVIERLIDALEGRKWRDLGAGLSPLERAVRQLQDMRQELNRVEDLYDQAAAQLAELRQRLGEG